VGNGFEVITDVAVCAVFIVWDVQPVVSTAEGLVEVLPEEGVDLAGDSFGVEGPPESGGGGGEVCA